MSLAMASSESESLDRSLLHIGNHYKTAATSVVREALNANSSRSDGMSRQDVIDVFMDILEGEKGEGEEDSDSTGTETDMEMEVDNGLK